MKKILASIAAAALAVSAMGVAAFASEPLKAPVDWSTPVEVFDESALAELENVDKLYEGELTVKYTISVTAGHEWANGTVVVRPKDADGKLGWTEQKFGGTSCEGQSWFADDAYIIADDAETFEVTVKADLTDMTGVSICAQSGGPGDPDSTVFALISVSMENEAGFKAVYADGTASVPADEDDNKGDGEEDNKGDGEEDNKGDGEEDNKGDGEEDNKGDGEEDNKGDETDASASEETSASESATTTSGVAGNVNGGDNGDKNQPTGLVLAVVPAAVAAAAVVISKKRK